MKHLPKISMFVWGLALGVLMTRLFHPDFKGPELSREEKLQNLYERCLLERISNSENGWLSDCRVIIQEPSDEFKLEVSRLR